MFHIFLLISSALTCESKSNRSKKLWVWLYFELKLVSEYQQVGLDAKNTRNSYFRTVHVKHWFPRQIMLALKKGYSWLLSPFWCPWVAPEGLGWRVGRRVTCLRWLRSASQLCAFVSRCPRPWLKNPTNSYFS